jgi:hypothetical protein
MAAREAMAARNGDIAPSCLDFGKKLDWPVVSRAQKIASAVIVVNLRLLERSRRAILPHTNYQPLAGGVG